jgi:hypothetical protein
MSADLPFAFSLLCLALAVALISAAIEALTNWLAYGRKTGKN